MYHVFRKMLHRIRANYTRFVEECVIIIIFNSFRVTISLPFKLHITMETANENTGYEKKKHQTNQQKQTRSGMEETGKLI